MDSLPDISMDIVEEVVEEVEENKIEGANEEPEEDNEAIIQDMETPKPKTKLSQEDIFQDPPVIKKVKEPKKKRVLSEEHKAKLAAARVKALETRRKNAALKKEEKELQKTIKHNKINKLRKEAEVEVREETAPIPIQQSVAETKPSTNYSKEDLEEFALNAILGHEKIRKARKAKKREEEAVAREQQLLKQQLRQAVAPAKKPTYSQGGVWDDFF